MQNVMSTLVFTFLCVGGAVEEWEEGDGGSGLQIRVATVSVSLSGPPLQAFALPAFALAFGSAVAFEVELASSGLPAATIPGCAAGSWCEKTHLSPLLQIPLL